MERVAEDAAAEAVEDHHHGDEDYQRADHVLQRVVGGAPDVNLCTKLLQLVLQEVLLHGAMPVRGLREVVRGGPTGLREVVRGGPTGR